MFSEAGSHHRSVGLANEDAVTSIANNTVAVIVVCDGAGGLKAGGIAARIVSETVANELHVKFKELYFSDSEAAKWEITRMVDDQLTNYARQNNLSPCDLACTIMAVAMDTDGRCVCFHLGDGIILRKKEKKEIWEVVSSPRNGLLENTTYLTMNCNMWRELQYYRWKDSELESIMVLTDGAAKHLVCRNRKCGWTFSEACEASVASMSKYLNELMPQDDYSGGIISRNNK